MNSREYKDSLGKQESINEDYDNDDKYKKNKKRIRDTLNLDKKHISVKKAPKPEIDKKNDRVPVVLCNNNIPQQPSQPQAPIIITQPGQQTAQPPIVIAQPSQPQAPIIITQPGQQTAQPPIVIAQPSQPQPPIITQPNGTSRMVCEVDASKYYRQKKSQAKKKEKKEGKKIKNINIYNGGYGGCDPFDASFSSLGNLQLPAQRKGHFAWTCNIIGMPGAMLGLYLKDAYDIYKTKPSLNTEGHTIFGFFRSLLPFDGGNLENFIKPVSLLARVLTSWEFQWNSARDTDIFTCSFLLTHMIFPAFSCELHTPYGKTCGIGIGLRFGIEEIAKVYIAVRFGGFYIKLNGPGLGILDFFYLFYNNGLKRNNTNKAKSKIFDLFKKLDDMFITKYITWDIQNPFARKLNMEDSLLFSILLSKLSIGLGHWNTSE